MKGPTQKPYQNLSGCTDLTAFEAINNVTREENRKAVKPVNHIARGDHKALFYVKYARYINHRSKSAKIRDCPLESEEQQILFAWARDNKDKHPVLAWLFHVPNGGLRNMPEAVRFKAEGVRAGFPDVVLPTARNGYHSLAIELKRQKHGQVSAEQKEWQAHLNDQGWLAVVCYGAYEAKRTIERYLLD